jgi:hypothetical protein
MAGDGSTQAHESSTLTQDCVRAGRKKEEAVEVSTISPSRWSGLCSSDFCLSHLGPLRQTTSLRHFWNVTFYSIFGIRQHADASANWKKSCKVKSDVASVMHTLCNLRLSAKDHPPPPPSLTTTMTRDQNKAQETKMCPERNSIHVSRVHAADTCTSKFDR